ncbi:MAG: YraN family protein [Gammaproteobacteria bacterium]
MTTRQQGLDAETRAHDYLQQQGLKPLARNVRSPRGEIDLIMEDDDTIVFVEVRLRNRYDFGSGAESVTRQKQQKLIATAAYFLQQNKRLAKRPARFDVISVQGQEHLDWIKNAFEV